jgi:hypothetical protein
MEEYEGGGDRADAPGAEAAPAQRLEGRLERRVAALGGSTDPGVQGVEDALIGNSDVVRG